MNLLPPHATRAGKKPIICLHAGKPSRLSSLEMMRPQCWRHCAYLAPQAVQDTGVARRGARGENGLRNFECPPLAGFHISKYEKNYYKKEERKIIKDPSFIGSLFSGGEKMGFSTSTCTEFVEVLASKAPVPGGGGASALVGAVGTALGNMVGSLTVGKKKYADVEDEMWELKAKCDQLQKDFLRLIERDAEVFEPLSKAYGMPKETEEEKAEKARVMEIVLKDACSVPMEIMEKCCEAIELIVEFGAKGSKLAISDAGVGAAFCKAALQGASLNVYINTKSMADREYAEELNKKADAMLEKYTKMADETFESVLGRLK
jgi:formiminotetrahydrofolate cyclodeaminase